MKTGSFPAALLLLLAFFFTAAFPAFAQKPIEALPETPDSLDMIMKESSPNALEKGSALSRGLSLRDHKAAVVGFEGNVRILKAGTVQWVPVQKNMLVEEGDQILTSSASHIDIAYDTEFLNIVRIEQKTKAEFRTIEPTDLYMEDGAIFSALDGLPAGANYQVSTPTAVAAVRGTHLVTLAAGGAFTDIAVTQDLKEHVSRVDITDQATGETFSVMENNQATFTDKGPEIGPVSPEIQNLADQAKEALLELGNPVELQETPGREMNPEDPSVNDKEEAGDEKPAGDGGNPPGGDDTLGSEGETGGALFSESGTEILTETAPGVSEAPEISESAVDAFMDSFIPPEDFIPVDGNGNPALEVQSAAKDGSEKSDPKQSDEPRPKTSGRQPGIQMQLTEKESSGESKGKPDVDAGALGEFFRVGLGDQFNAKALSKPAEVAVLATTVMQNLGFDATFSRQFGGVMEKFAEISGDFNNFMAQAGQNTQTSMLRDSTFKPEQFEDILKTGGTVRAADGSFDVNFNLNQIGVRTDAFAVDPNEFARIAIDNQLLQARVVVEIADEIFSQSNPFYFKVLEALQLNLTATEKATLLGQTSGTELYRPYVEFNADLDTDKEKIVNVRYFADGSDVHAKYDKIIDSDHSTVIQAQKTEAFTILSISACNPIDAESGGACD